jgi:hypothetical protein
MFRFMALRKIDRQNHDLNMALRCATGRVGPLPSKNGRYNLTPVFPNSDVVKLFLAKLDGFVNGAPGSGPLAKCSGQFRQDRP